ncbi:cytochrome c oxidase subunit 6B1-like [Hyposmocoma kahamanoa]|uniref:cytochrome c oxidase subunit 6B1-like n=1 Tax=Hyposmocoma kahamanoa TaxID=1477025 RepID=UPI000E6D5D71|nr:cytochrome c oxidase subunit 6B1-like [Hyposmocoma kahamanoa]
MPDVLKTPADLRTAPYDPRFPNTNQTRHCYQSYLDFHRCQKVRGGNYEACNYFKRVYRSLCPNEWSGRWDTQRAEGCFPGRI